MCLFACQAAGMVRGMYLDLIDRKSLSSAFLLPVTFINGVLGKNDAARDDGNLMQISDRQSTVTHCQAATYAQQQPGSYYSPMCLKRASIAML